ncbi:Zinc finger protein 112 [Papilio machaon]|uniref:Zinc finger protein 112 n=1 Tax=Papilio machaon TaxID=76193 RepID=A0A0N1IHJ6_PAPMA|nr:Zinc finger protein 112 [Papilio machaon]
MDDNTDIMVEPLPLLGICNLCLHDGVVKSMLIKYEHDGIAETYIEMLLKCFCIDVLSVDLEDTKRLICYSCIDELLHFMKFREKVETSLKSLEATVKLQKQTLTGVKKELVIEDLIKEVGDNDSDNNLDSLDAVCDVKQELEELMPDETDVDMLIKGEDSDEYIPKRTRRKTLSHKKKLYSIKKNSDTTETEYISDYNELREHIDVCTRLKSNRWSKLPFKLEKDQLDCPICNKRFLNFVNLNTHMNVHYPNHICENCGKSFASQARLRGHMRTHEYGDFPCRYCDAVFDRVTKRENHVSKEHKSGLRYACKRCNISLSSFYTRQKHLAEVHNEELKRYKCKACTQSYITPGHLSSHVRRDHLNERNHKCDKCDLAFYTKNALKMHMIKHDGERIHICHICQKSYQRLKTLREHMRIHNNDKRFICPICGRAFTQKCTLKGHLKVHDRKIDDTRVQDDMCTGRALVICRIEAPTTGV